MSESASQRDAGSDYYHQARSKHYYQGGYDQDFVDDLDRKFECPICLLCQRDPHQTSCGHRFCYSCILTWLNEGKTCPKDNCSLGEGDIFPDAMAHREILQLLVRCPNHSSGCTTVMHLADVQSHSQICSQRQKGPDPRQGPSAAAITASSPSDAAAAAVAAGSVLESVTCGACGQLVEEDVKSELMSHKELICPNVRIACPFATVGCSDKIPRKDLSHHITTTTQKHMSLLAEKCMKLQQTQSLSQPEPTDSSIGMTRTYSGSALQDTRKLAGDLAKKVVQLEQKIREKDIQIENMEKQVNSLSLANESRFKSDLGRFCHGTFVWRITDFPAYHDQMRHSHSTVFYSQGFYTSPFGYKMCLRCNININKGEEYLNIFIHLMPGDNDEFLDWPFQGKICITVLNQAKNRLHRENYSETIATRDPLRAYDQPAAASIRNVNGFGIHEFIRVNGLYSHGFVSERGNTLAIRATYEPLAGNEHSDH